MADISQHDQLLQVHRRLDSHDGRIGKLETQHAVAAERAETIQKSLDKIEGGIGWLIKLVIGGTHRFGVKGIDLCSAAEMIIACAAPLSTLEDDPAVRSLKGIVGGIEVQAQCGGGPALAERRISFGREIFLSG